MKIYTIGTTKRECHGHGDFSDDTSIQMFGNYGCEGFHPAFIYKHEAEEYLKTLNESNKFVVELNLLGGGLI
jgi:hypothetical protein